MRVVELTACNNAEPSMELAQRSRNITSHTPTNVAVHYVGYTSVGEFQMASVSLLQKPLLHLYSEFLKTGGCTARKARQIVFTDNGIRICSQNSVENIEQFFHYALITYTNTVVLRTFKSHGKKRYCMFEPTSPLSFTTGDRPQTLLPLQKRFSKFETIPTFPLVAVLYRPDPPSNDLHCHAFACISLEQSNEFHAEIQGRVKSFFEDYETLSVDDDMFSTPVPDFWKLTGDGWRMTMTRRMSRSQPSLDSDNEDSRCDEVVTNVRTQNKDLAIFAQAKVMSRSHSTGGTDLFGEYRVQNNDSGVESPTAEVGEVHQESPRHRPIPKHVSGGVRVLPAAGYNGAKPANLIRRGPPVAPKPKNYRLSTLEGTESGSVFRSVDDNPHERESVLKLEIDKSEKEEGRQPSVEKIEPKSPEDEKPERNQFHRKEQEIETKPVEEWDWEEVGDQAEPEAAPLEESKVIRRPSETRTVSPEAFQRTNAIRKFTDTDTRQRRRAKSCDFEGPILMTKSDSFLSDEAKEPRGGLYSPKDSEIESLISDVIYTNGFDSVEKSASMMNFERSLGYLP